MIKGDVVDIIYRNEENGFSIVVMDVEGDPIVCKGTFPTVVEGQTMSLDGKFIVHPKYGKQFDVTNVTICTPDSIDSIVRYLGSGIIRGIGPRLALRIASYFGEKTFEVIEFTPHLLAKVSGISKAKAQEIAEAYMSIKVMQDAIMFLQKYGITLNMALKIYKVYDKETIDTVSSNPYVLVEDVDGIGFLTADKIAQNMGISHDSEFRIRAGVIYALKESVRGNGNTYLPKDELIGVASKLLAVDSELVEKAIDDLSVARKIRLIDTENGVSIMLYSVYKVEHEAGYLISSIVDDDNFIEYDVLSDLVSFEKLHGITFHESQKRAIDLAINSGAVIITGGPGTGKTTIIKCIIHLYMTMGKKVVCMAPTGRASKRMSEATGFDAGTIHRVLGITPDSENSCKEPLEADVIIVDEFSMVDIFLFRTLLSRIPKGTRLVMVGDKDQLPSVGAGNVLSDLIASGVVPAVSLTHIYRQSLQSLIVTNAHAINKGEMPNLGVKDKDFFFMRANTPDEIATLTTSVASERIPKYLGVSPDKVQVLCPLKMGNAGVVNLNRQLQNKLNPTRIDKIETEDYEFAVGDKVMHTQNNYELEWKIVQGYRVVEGKGVFNGDIGTVTEVNKTARTLEVTFEDCRRATYGGEDISELMLAYAITVHKSQGSEFDAVIMPIVSGSPMIMTRNLLYTAITRAKRTVVLIGEEYNIKKMVNNDYVAKRYSALVKFIDESIDKRKLLYGDKKPTTYEEKFDKAFGLNIQNNSETLET